STATPSPCSTYVAWNTTSDCLAEAAGSGHQLLSTTGTGAQLTRVVPASAADEVTFAFTADSSSLADWGTGQYVVGLNVITKDGPVSYKVQLVRVAANCGAATVLATTAAQTGIGLQSFVFTGVSSSGAASDRLQLRILGSATNGTNRNFTIQVNDTNAVVGLP